MCSSLLLGWLFLAHPVPADETGETYTLLSPNERLAVVVSLDATGTPRYAVTLDGADVIEPSLLGLWFQSRLDLLAGFRVTGVERRAADTTWEQPWGERRRVTDRHNELLLRLTAPTPERRLDLRFRAFDDGVGFRYEVPDQDAYSDVFLVGERTEFRVSRDARAFSQSANGGEGAARRYAESPVGVLDLVATPLVLRLESGVHLALHEAALVDYPAASLEFDVDSIFRTRLRPSSAGYRAALTVPFVTPWRTVQVADNAVGLINSSLILNLNEPAVRGQEAPIAPGKYIRIEPPRSRGEAGLTNAEGRGTTTADARRVIDFAARHGIDGAMIGAWMPGVGTGDDGRLSDPPSLPDVDLEAVAAHASAMGVRLVPHHQTGGLVTADATRLEDAFAFYARLGIRQVSVGYPGPGAQLTRIDTNGERRTEWHDGQFAVEHYRRVVDAAAAQRIAVSLEGAVKATGLRRTWPNRLTQEPAFDAEDDTGSDTPAPPGDAAMLAFTRLLAGPMAYASGIFALDGRSGDAPGRVGSTLAKQLALYVVFHSPLQRLADRPAHYASRPDAFRFIVDVPTDWDDSIALAGAVGEYVVTVRRERGGADWYLGAVTDDHPRRLSVPLDFLEPGRAYAAEIYADGTDADWQTNPTAIEITTREYTRTDTLELTLAAGGGAAIRFRPVT